MRKHLSWIFMLLLLSACGREALTPTATTVSEAAPTSTSDSGIELIIETAIPSETAAEPSALQTPEDILEFLLERPESVGLVSYTVAEDGSIEASDPVIQHNAEQPMPLASAIKTVLLAAYAVDVTEGRLDPEQPVTLAEWEAYYLPGTDGDAHITALDELGIERTPEGFAIDQSQTVPLSTIARVMIEFSDNAATDFMLNLIDPATLDQVLALPELAHQERPESILGAFLLIGNHEQPPLDQSALPELQALSDAEWTARLEELETKYTQTDWGATEREWRQTNQALPPYIVQMAFVEALMPKGAAADYAAMMAGIYTGTFISPEVSEIMRESLEWPMRMEGNDEFFSVLGAKGGSLPGVLTNAMYLTPQDSPWSGPTRVVVLFQNNLAAPPWYTFLRTFSQQNFELMLAIDPEFASNVAEQFEP